MNVLVLLGGNSPERDVSLRSGTAVAEALISAGHKVSKYDPINGYQGLDKFINEVDVIFPILHGIGGEDGEVQKELEARKFRFLGSGSEVSKLCFDKVRSKEKIVEIGFKTPKSEVVDLDSFTKSDIAKASFVLKPIEGGSTIDTFIINDPNDKIDLTIFNRYSTMLLEELIEGVEITVPVLADKALPVIEIIPPEGEDFDYENKYNGETQELCPAENVTTKLQHQAQDIALTLHKSLEVKHLSRTDIIINENNELYVLEINTMPGMTNQSLFPKAASVSGLTMEQLVENFIELTRKG